MAGAMCLHHDTAADRPLGQSSKYLETAEVHGRIFVQEASEKMQNFRQSEYDAILACSRLLCVLGFAFHPIHRQRGATLADPEAWNWLQLVRGVKASWFTIAASGGKFSDLVAEDMGPGSWSPGPSDREPHKPLGFRHPSFSYFKETRWERIHALRAFFAANKTFLGDQDVEDIGHAVDQLCEMTEHICSPEAPSMFRIICRWPANISKGFVSLILEGFPPALVVFAHWLMSVILVEDLWWVSDMGRAGIQDIVDICSDTSLEAQALLKWPQEMVNLAR